MRRKRMKKNWKQTTLKASSILLATILLIGFGVGSVFADTDKPETISENMGIEISDAEYAILKKTENNIITDQEIEESLIKSGYATREELKEIDDAYMKQLKDAGLLARAKYINGYNKHRVFKKNGKHYLYIYISGKTLYMIKQGLPIADLVYGAIPGWVVKILLASPLLEMHGIIDEAGTTYGVVLKHVELRWDIHVVGYVYQYYGWFYQT